MSGLRLSGIRNCLAHMQIKCTEMQSLNEELRAYNSPDSLHNYLTRLVTFNSNVCGFMLKYIAQTNQFLYQRYGPTTDVGQRWMDFGGPLAALRDFPEFQAEDRIRQQVLMETLVAFERASPTCMYHLLGQANLHRWANAASDRVLQSPCVVFVEKLDWGELARKMTKNFGKQFAVLNTAAGFSAGGGYVPTDRLPLLALTQRCSGSRNWVVLPRIQ